MDDHKKREEMENAIDYATEERREQDLCRMGEYGSDQGVAHLNRRRNNGREEVPRPTVGMILGRIEEADGIEGKGSLARTIMREVVSPYIEQLERAVQRLGSEVEAVREGRNHERG